MLVTAARNAAELRPLRVRLRPEAGDMIRRARRALDVTQRDLGLLLGYPLLRAQSEVSKLESDPKVDIALSAAAILGIAWTDLLELAEGSQTSNPFA